MPEEKPFDHKAAAESFTIDGGKIVKETANSTHAWHPDYPTFTFQFGWSSLLQANAAILRHNGGNPKAPSAFKVHVNAQGDHAFEDAQGHTVQGIPSEHGDLSLKVSQALWKAQQALIHA